MENKIYLVTRSGAGAKSVSVINQDENIIKIFSQNQKENLLFQVQADNDTFYIGTHMLHENGGIIDIAIETFSKKNNRLVIIY